MLKPMAKRLGGVKCLEVESSKCRGERKLQDVASFLKNYKSGGAAHLAKVPYIRGQK